MNQTKNKPLNPVLVFIIVLMVVLFLTYMAIGSMLDPNPMDDSARSLLNHNFGFTLTRLQGGIFGMLAVTVFIKYLVNEKYREKAYRICWVVGAPIILMVCFASSLFAVTFEVSWGFWRSVHIDDPKMLFFEYVWLFFSGLLGPFLYYRYIIQDKLGLFFYNASNND